MHFTKQSSVINVIQVLLKVPTTKDRKKATSRLLVVLLAHEVALELRSSPGNRNLASELAGVFGRVASGDFNYGHYRVLSQSGHQQGSRHRYLARRTRPHYLTLTTYLSYKHSPLV